MIGIVGNMSGGKTYSAVHDMLQRLRSGHVVVTNIELNVDGVSDYLGVDFSLWGRQYYRLVDDEESNPSLHLLSSSDYDSWPCGSPRGSATYDRDMVYIYLDEVSSIFDAMTSGASESIKRVAAWARHTEKRGQMLFLIMQFENELHKRLRVHITEYIFCRNMTQVKMPIFRFKLPKAFFNFIAQIHLLPDGETTLGTPNFLPLDPRVFACYRTAQIVVGASSFGGHDDVEFDGDIDCLRNSLRLLIFSFCVFTLVSVVCYACSCL